MRSCRQSRCTSRRRESRDADNSGADVPDAAGGASRRANEAWALLLLDQVRLVLLLRCSDDSGHAAAFEGGRVCGKKPHTTASPPLFALALISPLEDDAPIARRVVALTEGLATSACRGGTRVVSP